jgi:hypothetical protein
LKPPERFHGLFIASPCSFWRSRCFRSAREFAARRKGVGAGSATCADGAEYSEKLVVEPGQAAEVSTPKLFFEWMLMHDEQTGSGLRSHGYVVQVLQDGVVIGKAASHRSLQKTE